MARIQHLITLLLLSVTCLTCWATITPTSTVLWNNSGMYLSTNPATTCTMFAVANGQSSGVLSGSSPTYRCQAGSFNVPIGQIVQSVCPANSTLSGSVCSCNSGFLESGQACVSAAENCKNVAAAMSIADSFTAAGAGLSLCYGGCSINASASTTGKKNGAALPTEYHGPFTSDGSACTTSPASQTQTPCPVGSTLGDVNGLSLCSPDPSTNVVQAGPKTAASAPSSASSAPVVDSQAPTGSTGSSTSTSCTGGNCTTTKTYTNSGGAVTGTVTKAETQSEFCASNPGAAMCQKTGAFSGTCGTAPACTGDAVMCAVAAATFKTNCALAKPASDPAVDAYTTAAGKDQGDQTTSITTSVTINSSKFDQSDALGVAGGLQDQTIDIAGKTVVIPWSVVGDKLHIVGLIMQAVTFLLCARIVMRG